MDRKNSFGSGSSVFHKPGAHQGLGGLRPSNSAPVGAPTAPMIINNYHIINNI
jgi:hypothetical protein